METVEKIKVEISIAGKSVTGDISPYLSQITYNDRIEAESDDVSLVVEDTENKWLNDWYPTKGDSMSIKIGTEGDMLDCGVFEIDEVEFESPPDTMIVKAIGAAITKSLRTQNSKAFEKQSLKKIAQYFADKHSLKLTGNLGQLAKIQIERKTQDKQTDISFLASLAKEFGIVFSVRGDKLIFMDAEELDRQTSIMTLNKSQLSNMRFKDKTSQVYEAATVAVRNVRANSVKKWQIKPSGDSAKRDTLIIGGAVENESQAQAKAKGGMKEKNKDKITGSFLLVGNVKMVAGVNVDLQGIGKLAGKWRVVQSTHNVTKDGGYTTAVTVQKIIS